MNTLRRYTRPALFSVGILILAYVLFRIFVHSSALLRPALITPEMDAHRLLAPSLDARIQRVIHEVEDRHSDTEHRLIALTFDDGPYAVTTPLLLATLQELHVPATFFVIGRDVEQQPDLMRRIVDGGFEVADHTRSHPNLDQLTTRDVSAELLGGSGILARFTDAPSARTLFRPPHGRYTEVTIRTAQALGYTTLLWNDDPGDWHQDDPEALLQHIQRHATAPEVLLLHSGRIATIHMLVKMVPAFRAAGYEFVTAGELLRRVPGTEINHPIRFNIEKYFSAGGASDESPDAVDQTEKPAAIAP